MGMCGAGCQGGSTAPARDAGRASDGGASDSGSDAGSPDSGLPDAGPSDAGARDGGERDGGEETPECLVARGAVTARVVAHGPDIATVTLDRDTPCSRTYSIQTSAPLRDHPYGSPRVIAEGAGPFLRSGDLLLDALYAMTEVERIDSSVASIADGAFDEGRPFACPAPGCFETGRLWTWVWTRDSAYAADLGLALLDPDRMRSTLSLKLSTRRDGTDLQIVQDTGSGGSYPVSTDRVSWALGARRTLATLNGATAETFAARALEALTNTLEHDRVVVFDPSDGLYRGELSFLDWREQSYAPWTAQDTVHLAMSKALSTNVLHVEALRFASALAARAGDAETSDRYSRWASSLGDAIHAAFWLPDDGLYSSHLPTTLDAAPARRFDLLGSSLAVLAGLGDASTRARAVANYPHLERGPPVMWPQSTEVPIYHNRAIWPFVTAYAMRAAKAVGNAAVVTHAARSLYDGAALNLSNMENLEVETGRAWVEDGPRSGPVVDSQRQLWSVAAMYTLVHEIVFGLEITPSGPAVTAGLTRALRRSWFAGTASIALNDVPWRGGALAIVLELPPEKSAGDAMLAVASLRVDGVEVSSLEDLEGDHVVTVVLVDEGPETGTIRRVTDGAIFAPPTPSIALVQAPGPITLTLAGDDRGATWSIYRDGVRIAEGLPEGTTTFADPGTSASSPSHCYAAELVTASRASHRSAPACWWGPGFERTRSFGAAAFLAIGGAFVNNHGRDHYEGWGDPGDSIAVTFTPDFSGPHLVQLSAGNGAGPVDTGVTCGVKRVRVEEASNGAVVAEGYVVMPHLGTWSRWADSSFLPVTLDSSTAYRIVVDMDDFATNMSAFDHFARYTGGEGGANGSFFRVNIDQIKVLSRTSTP